MFQILIIEDPSLSWPPPDPDRIPRMHRPFQLENPFTHNQDQTSDHDVIEAFRRRQEQDMRRSQSGELQIHRRKPFHDRYSVEEGEYGTESRSGGSSGGEEGWRNSEGDRLRDFGVEEEVEFYDEDNVPLAELLRRRKKGRVNNHMRST